MFQALVFYARMYLIITCALILSSVLSVFLAFKRRKRFGKPEMVSNGAMKLIRPCNVIEECETVEATPIDQEPSSAAANGRSARKFSWNLKVYFLFYMQL